MGGRHRVFQSEGTERGPGGGNVTVYRRGDAFDDVGDRCGEREKLELKRHDSRRGEGTSPLSFRFLQSEEPRGVRRVGGAHKQPAD